MYTKDEITGFRRQLVALANRLDRDRTHLKEEVLQPSGGEASGGLSDVPIHRADLASRDYEEVTMLGLVNNEEHILDLIRGALERIEEGTFGRCEECHKQISKRRLHALPYTPFCVECATVAAAST